LDPQVNRASENFAQGLDQYIASGDPTLLRLVAEQDVLGEWGMRADAILKLNEKIVSLKKEIVGLNKEVDNLNKEIAGLNQKLENQQDQLKIKEQQLSRTQETKQLLSRDNEILEVTLERLRQALIDLEKREQ
jgi:chromosome segregation ATPase